MNDAVTALEAYGKSRIGFWINPPRGQCEAEDCPEADCILHETESGQQVCASHYREQADRYKAYPCDNCGHTPSFRDPLGRKNELLCNDCHARNGYIPGDRSMITKIARREGVTHRLGRRDVCIAAGRGTECKGQVKQRDKRGVMCDKHADPVKWNAGRQG